MSTAKQSAPRPAAKRPGDPIVRLLFWVLVALSTASFLEFKGPTKGWLTARFGPHAPAEPIIVDDDQIEPIDEVAVQPPEVVDGSTDVAKPAPEEPPKSEMEQLYDRLYAKYLAKYSPPKPGATLKLKLRSGDTVAGILDEVSPGRVKLRMKFGTMTYALHVVHPTMYPYLFPERAAKMQALKELEQILDKRRAEEEATLTAQAELAKPPARLTEPAAPVTTTVQTEAPSRPKPTKRPQPPRFVADADSDDFRYDSSDASTPEHLQRTVQAFGMRLNYQQRALGAPIAKKIFAKQQGGKVVLYMEVSRTFQAQSYDVRYALADQLWSIWSMRCRDGGKVRNANGAHLVMIDQSGKQVGGSTENAAADIWVKQGKG